MNQDSGISNTNSFSGFLRELFLFTAILLGVSVTIITEILSAFSLITSRWLLAFWGVALFICTCFVTRFAKRQRPVFLFLSFRLPFRAIPLLSGLILVITLTGVTAFLSPPNNWDSMTYHMSRVVHWIQDHNVSFYPTHILRQLYMNPWAEFAIMHLQILSGGDRFANFVQWSSMIGCLIGASLLAKQLGADLQSQLFAAVFAGTIPMGILQSSSTQNDYVVSFWLLCFVYFCISFIRQINWSYVSAAGFSLGLVVSTKGTAYIFAPPFLAWMGYALLRTFHSKSWKPALAIGVASLVLNFGHYTRNFNLFGSPLGPRVEDSLAKITSDVISPSSVLSNITRNLALHLGTPSWRINIGIDDAIGELHRILNIDINDPRTTWPRQKFQVLKPSLHEDTAGNLLHLSLILVAIFLFFISKEIRSSSALLSYLAALLSGFLLFCTLLKWQPWNSRLQLPLFVLASPFVAAVLFKRLNEKFVITISFALLLSALPWVLFNTSRSLIGDPSVWNRSRFDQYFKNRPEIRDAYLGAAHFLKSKKCSQIGLAMGSNDWEYPFWPLLKTKRSETIRIEHVHVKNGSGSLSTLLYFSSFSPCAIISSRADQVEELATETGAYSKKWASIPISVFIRQARPEAP
jgi:hypothetical protein